MVLALDARKARLYKGLRRAGSYCRLGPAFGWARKLRPRFLRMTWAGRLKASWRVKTPQAKQSQERDQRTRVLLVDDHAVVRYGIAQIINRESDMVVCGEEEDASKAMSAIGTLKPGLVAISHR